MQEGTRKKAPATGAFDCSASLPLSISGVPVHAHPAGVLYVEQAATLIVADLHLEKGSSFAEKQIFLPPYDTARTLKSLEAALSGFKPKRVIALGDSFHDGGGPSRLCASDRQTLNELVSSVDWIWVAGNHDPALPEDLGGLFCDEATIGKLVLSHEPREGAKAEIAGHLHPSARVRGRGRSVRKRCFVANAERLILPAFGAYTGGLNVRDVAFAPHFPEADFHAYMMGSEKLFPVAASACLPG
ncbi:MAG: ligase-associated DNA damage response endonuclease PdeM [Pseudomonadota bacterium]